MGSSLHLHWVLVAVICGVFYLIFDALRSFALQLSPVRLRRLSTDAEEGMSRFTNFEVVTRYNRSTFYASAVIELADAIRKAHSRVQLASTRASSQTIR